MRQWIGIVILAAGLVTAPQDSSAQEIPQPAPPPVQTPPPQPEQVEPSRFKKFLGAVAPDSLDIGITKCSGCREAAVNGGALMGMGWELPTPAPMKNKGLVFATGLALISEEPGDKDGGSSADKESNLQCGATLGLQYRLINFISLKGGVAYGSRTWGFVVFSMNYNASDKPPDKPSDKPVK